jgi:protocatechuate 3,4-dioxygenase beta subunit
MHNDDRPIGQLLTRREALRVLGLTGAALVVSCAPEVMGGVPLTEPASTGDMANGTPSALPACVVRPEMTEGPYFVDERLLRSDIRSDPSTGELREGAPLELTVNVSRVNSNGCSPLADATVDIWHCDALGVYSDVSDPGFSTVGQKFLRGYQVTNANGQVKFTTIYPGWYQGRTVHIHFKIRSGNYDFTSQWFFDDELSDQVFTRQPYAAEGERTTRNANDGIFLNGGSHLMLEVAEVGEGFAARSDIGLDLG